MTTFVFTELVNDPLANIESAALGASNAGTFAQADVGKAVKLGTANNYVMVADGDDIEGFVVSVEPFTVNGGFSFGSVVKNRRVIAQVAAAQVGQIAIGAEVIAGIPIALGTAALAMVKAGTGSKFKWRVLRHVTGNGSAGDQVLLERI